MPIMKSSTVAGSKLISDEWKSYNDIGKCGYKHYTVRHCENFLDPATDGSTNRVEGMWKIAKFENRKRWRSHRTLLGSYLFEFMWQKTKNAGKKGLFEEILDDISTLNSPIKIQVFMF